MKAAFLYLQAFVLTTFVGIASAAPPPLPAKRQHWNDYCSLSSIQYDASYICFETTDGYPDTTNVSPDVNVLELALDHDRPELIHFGFVLGSSKDSFTFTTPRHVVDIQAAQPWGCVNYRIMNNESERAKTKFSIRCRGWSPVKF
ncbi:uncharacterized protein UTRI_04987 [Ustilago trichophora]|uniref:Mig1 protein n=1 Tax=Ustilago trichophora TaxID=86804 RepID=A0A5C3EAX7_9BASI|nr:uncharacterized protein UTRI_04987 [Ustilago trichophora]